MLQRQLQEAVRDAFQSVGIKLQHCKATEADFQGLEAGPAEFGKA